MSQRVMKELKRKSMVLKLLLNIAFLHTASSFTAASEIELPTSAIMSGMDPVLCRREFGRSGHIDALTRCWFRPCHRLDH